MVRVGSQNQYHKEDENIQLAVHVERKKEALKDGINTCWNVEVHSTWVCAAAKTKDQEVDCAGCG